MKVDINNLLGEIKTNLKEIETKIDRNVVENECLWKQKSMLESYKYQLEEIIKKQEVKVNEIQLG